MKLKKVKAYRTEAGKDYFRWDVSLPPALVEERRWEKGDELEAVAHKDGILIRKPK